MTNDKSTSKEKLTAREKHGYIVAYILIISGVLMGFLSFFLNNYDINTGVLLYIAQAFVIGGGLVGATVYFKSQFLEFESKTNDKLNQINEEIQKMK